MSDERPPTLLIHSTFYFNRHDTYGGDGRLDTDRLHFRKKGVSDLVDTFTGLGPYFTFRVESGRMDDSGKSRANSRARLQKWNSTQDLPTLITHN